MARISSILGILRALRQAGWRDFRSIGSIAGQNLFIFLIAVALQPESAGFFFLILLVVLIFPLSADPMQKIPLDRRATWPLLPWEWRSIRLASLTLSPISWVAAVLILAKVSRTGGLLLLPAGAVLQLLNSLVKRSLQRLPKANWLYWIPAPPGIIGAIMRLQWRGILRTLDPYVALVLALSTTLFSLFTKLDPAAPRIMSLVVTLALSTQTQVLLGMDGAGAERYRQLPIRGWQLLLAKDLAFLALLALLVLPLDPFSGLTAGLIALTLGHHRSVMQILPQTPWRFTSGVLFPDGLLQTVLLFAGGNVVREQGLWLVALCLSAWLASLLIYGWQWDRHHAAD